MNIFNEYYSLHIIAYENHHGFDHNESHNINEQVYYNEFYSFA